MLKSAASDDMKYFFKLANKTFKVYLEGEYIIKLNNSPTKGLLIDTYLPLPNPFYFHKLTNNATQTIIANPNHIYYRVMVARHWPKTIREDHMQILLPYSIPYREYIFKGPRDIPPGDFKIIERGTFRIFDLFIQGYFFVYIIGFQRKIGLLNSVAKGSTYALYFDKGKIFETSTMRLKQWNIEPVFMRLQKIKIGLPNYEYFDKKVQVTNADFVPFFGFKRIQY